ncbi:hypothetical protein D3C73_1370510 [compost metagenome]
MNHPFAPRINRLTAQRFYTEEDQTASVECRNRQQIEDSQIQAKYRCPIGQILNPLLGNLPGQLRRSNRT